MNLKGSVNMKRQFKRMLKKRKQDKMELLKDNALITAIYVLWFSKLENQEQSEMIELSEKEITFLEKNGFEGHELDMIKQRTGLFKEIFENQGKLFNMSANVLLSLGHDPMAILETFKGWKEKKVSLKDQSLKCTKLIAEYLERE